MHDCDTCVFAANPYKSEPCVSCIQGSDSSELKWKPNAISAGLIAAGRRAGIEEAAKACSAVVSMGTRDCVRVIRALLEAKP